MSEPVLIAQGRAELGGNCCTATTKARLNRVGHITAHDAHLLALLAGRTDRLSENKFFYT
jgi:hypothetical protein